MDSGFGRCCPGGGLRLVNLALSHWRPASRKQSPDRSAQGTRMQIKGCVALVTGASRGLGRAFAAGLLNAGAAKVYAAARDPTKPNVSGAQAIKLDITNAAEVARAAEQYGDVNLLINNAGIA